MTSALIRKCVCAVLVAAAAAADAPEPPEQQTDPRIVQAVLAECAERAAAAEKNATLAVAGRDGWLFLAAELRHVSVRRFWGDDAVKVSRAAKPEWADPLPAIVDFKTQLEKAGVELLVVPVPAKAAIYAEMLSQSVTAESAAGASAAIAAPYRDFLAALRDAGVKTIDLVPEFIANRFHADGALYCKQDTHWSGNGCVLAARRIASYVRERPWASALGVTTLEAEWRDVEITGDLRRALGDATAPARETVRLRFVGRRTGAGLEPLEPDPSSPLVLMGDSHVLVFHAGADLHARGAGLADQLAFELGSAIDVVGVRGSGSTAPRMNFHHRVLSRPDYLSGKRLVIWCFGARQLTEGDGWRKIPVGKEPASQADGRPQVRTEALSGADGR